MKREPQEVVLYPMMTEDAVSSIEAENKLTFVVAINADKGEIRRAVEALYEVKVASVNTAITSDGRKKAFVKLSPDFKASDVAVRMGIL